MGLIGGGTFPEPPKNIPGTGLACGEINAAAPNPARHTDTFSFRALFLPPPPMNGLHLPARALRTISAFLRVEYLTAVSDRRPPFLRDGSVEILSFRMARASGRPLGGEPQRVASAVSPGPAGALRSLAAFDTAAGGQRVFAYFCGRPVGNDCSADFSCMDTSARPPRTLPVPRGEEMDSCMHGLVAGAFARLPGDPDLVVVASQMLRLGEGWRLHLLDLERVALRRTLVVRPPASFCSALPEVHSLDGDAAHVYVVADDLGGTISGHRVCVRTGAVLASTAVEEPEGDGYDEVHLAMLPLPGDRWVAISNHAAVRFVGGGAATPDTADEQFRREAVGAGGRLSRVWPIGAGRVLLADGTGSRLVLARADAAAGRLRVLHVLDGQYQWNLAMAVHTPFAPQRGAGGRPPVLLRMPSTKSLVVDTEGDRLRCRRIARMVVGSGSAEHPGFAAACKQLWRQQEARVARASAAASGGK